MKRYQAEVSVTAPVRGTYYLLFSAANKASAMHHIERLISIPVPPVVDNIDLSVVGQKSEYPDDFYVEFETFSR